MKKGILFLICLAGGVLFGGLFFALFGIEAGYSWFLAGLCAACGLLFAVLFFIVWIIVEKRSKPITFEDLSAQLRLQENEKNFDPFDPYEARFHARIPQGRGLKAAVCETYIYLLSEKLRISCSYFRKIYTVEVDYNNLIAYVDSDACFLFRWQEGMVWGRFIDEDVTSFIDRLKGKGVNVREEAPESEI